MSGVPLTTGAGSDTSSPVASGINALAQSIRNGEVQGAQINASLANLAQSVGLAPKPPPPPPATLSPTAIVVGVVALILVGGLVVFLVKKMRH